MNATILQRLRQTNPWLFGGASPGTTGASSLPDPFVARTQVDAERLLSPGRAHVIIGPRQAGKSTLAWSVLTGLSRPLFLNMEEALLRGWCDSTAGLVDDIAYLGDPPEALFVEEAQRLDGAALFVKGLVDHRPPFPIIVTGSASFHLGDRARESLAGRATRHTLLPLSLEEVAPDGVASGPADLELRRRDALERQLRIGGYPEVWLSPEPQRVLGDLMQAFLLRDASDLFAVERLDAYQALLRLCAGQVGNLVNLSELASVCGVSVNTVSRYLSLMEEAHLLRLVPSFSGGKRREVTAARKVYFLDTGLRSTVLGRPLDQPLTLTARGPTVESWVLGELAKTLPWHQPVRYWRSLSGAEVDFVVDAPGHLLAIEVKAGAMPRPRLPRSCRSFVDAYHPGELWILSDDLCARDTLGRTEVRWLPLHELPVRLHRWMDGAGLFRE